MNIRRVLKWTLFGASLAAAYGQAATYNFYKLAPSTFKIGQADELARTYNLIPAEGSANYPGTYQAADGSVRLAFQNGGFHFTPELRSLTSEAPTAAEVQRMAPTFFNKFGLLTSGIKLSLGPSMVWAKGDADVKGSETKPLDLLRTQTYLQVLDGMPVFGPRHMLSITADSQGVVGLIDTLVPAVQVTSLRVLPKSESQVTREFQMKVQEHCLRGTYKLKGRRLAYFEQGISYIQPAYFYDVEYIDDKGNTSGETIVVPVAQNSPESIRKEINTTGVPPIMPDVVPATGSAEMNWLDEALASTVGAQAASVIVGQYIVRNDHPCWLTDAQAFWTNVNAARTLTPWHPGITRRDYWWDYPWLWEAALGIADNSPYYVNQDHFVQIEGHGAPWEITCYQNYGDIIDLTKIAGYGKNRLNGKTTYIEWQSCDVIPVPGDPFGGLWTSGSPFSVWWNIFKGMRGNFGYHTTMGICNGVSANWGFQIGLGFPMTSAWLNCTASNPQGHPSGWNYGSAVIVSGHEADTFYDTAGLPNPSSLTMWWIHP